MQREGPHQVPVLGEVVSVMEEEVSAIDMDEGPQMEVLGPIALLSHQLLVGTSHMEVLRSAMSLCVGKEGEGGMEGFVKSVGRFL